jgi:fibro-slime domain-containing protein
MSSHAFVTFAVLAVASAGCIAKGGGSTFSMDSLEGSGGAAGSAAGSAGSAGAAGHVATGLAGSTPFLNVDPEASAPDPDAEPKPGIYMLPDGFTPAIKGGYKLGAPIGATLPPEEMDAGSVGGCGGTIRGITRDFKRGDKPGGHPDFETFMGNGEKGIVQQQLGTDLKPVYVDTKHMFTTTKANFDQWYRNVDGVNKPYLVYLVVQPNGAVFTFESDAFFPLDGQGWGNEGFVPDHNFSFTTEVHTKFKYNGGETFSFSGDDDVWVFINGKLAIDLGGLHPAQMDQVSLDAQAATLGISPGNVYALDLFHAERHSTASNFRIDTNLEFVDCGIIVDVR